MWMISSELVSAGYKWIGNGILVASDGCGRKEKVLLCSMVGRAG
jgi:hypothetical protein